MLHISAERLAALVDETALPDEATHLAACAHCERELGAHRRLVRLAFNAGQQEQPPLGDWVSLGAMLKAEGIVSVAPQAPVASLRTSRRQWMVRIAAGFALVAGSVVAGRWTAGFGVSFNGAPVGTTAQQVAAPAAENFESPQAAMQVLTSAQQQYSDAAVYLAGQDTTAHFIGLNVNTYRARLGALDQIVAATRAALYQAPQDPVLNQYYLSAVAAREATLRQYKAALPASQKLERY